MASMNAPSAWVIPDQLRSARESLKLSQREAAERLGISEDELKQWETGRGSPNLSQLRRFTEVYKRQARFFFVREEIYPLTDYRLVPSERLGIFGRKTLEALVEFESWCRRSWELEQILGWQAEVLVGRSYMEENAEDVAALERGRLEQFGLKVARRLGSLPYREVFQCYREAIERLGVRVFALDMPVEDLRGASWWHEEYGPAILVNRTDWVAPRLFTLAHEYGHLLFHERGATSVCNLNGEADIERFANRFAAELLVPREAISASLQRRGWEDKREWDDPDIKSLSRTLRVSRDVVALRLEELGLARRGFYTMKRAQWEREPREEDRYRVRAKRPQWIIQIEDRLGSRYEQLVLQAFGQGELTVADLTRYLDLSVNQVEQWLVSRNVRGYLGGRSL